MINSNISQLSKCSLDDDDNDDENEEYATGRFAGGESSPGINDRSFEAETEADLEFAASQPSSASRPSYARAKQSGRSYVHVPQQIALLTSPR
jgi:hypothetical protein